MSSCGTAQDYGRQAQTSPLTCAERWVISEAQSEKSSISSLLVELMNQRLDLLRDVPETFARREKVSHFCFRRDLLRPVLVSGTKKLFLKWIGRALRKNRTQVPDSNGAVCWNLANTFFPVGGMTRR